MPRNPHLDLHLVPNTPAPRPLDRRGEISEMEIAARTLHKATRHLMSEQQMANQNTLPANREAIRILCTAAKKLTREDRRETSRRYTVRWLWDAIGWTR